MTTSMNLAHAIALVRPAEVELMKKLNKKFSKLGYECLAENKYAVRYGKNLARYRHIISISHKRGGGYLVQSFQEDINSDGLNNMVGISNKEWKLVIKAVRRMYRKYKWGKW